MEPLAPIYPILTKYGCTCDAAEFQKIINLVFHQAESRVYDKIHRPMWKSLPMIFRLLAADYLAEGASSRSDLSVLDVGCGTGLASDLLLKTRMGCQVASIHLLDTSTEMLAQAQRRARRWRVQTRGTVGAIDAINSAEKYDIILTCSVLHHIPDLAEFLRFVRKLQAPSGVFLHLQDPNGDALDDAVLAQRIAHRDSLTSPRPLSLAKRLYRKLTHRLDDDYMKRVNDELLARKVVAAPMTDEDLWRVTDIHDHDGTGISIREVSARLEAYRLVSMRSYSFFGKMYSELSPALRREEQSLLEQKATNGLRIAALWRLADQSG